MNKFPEYGWCVIGHESVEITIRIQFQLLRLEDCPYCVEIGGTLLIVWTNAFYEVFVGWRSPRQSHTCSDGRLSQLSHSTKTGYLKMYLECLRVVAARRRQ